MNWLKILIPVAVVGIGVAVVAGGKKCTLLDSAEKVNRWAEKNGGRTPDRFVMIGFWDQVWLDIFCEKPSAETVAINSKKLTGQQLEILEAQGLETDFPKTNMVLAFRKQPEPQIYMEGGDGAAAAKTARVNVDRFLAGEIEGFPVELPGGRAIPTTSPGSVADLLTRITT